MAQFGRASDLGSEGRRFKSCYPDHKKRRMATSQLIARFHQSYGFVRYINR